MKSRRSSAALLAPLLLAASGLLPAAAELPTLDKAPWINYFAAYSSRTFRIGISTKGLIELSVMKDKDVPVIDKLVIPIAITVQESLPDGRVIERKLDPESLTSKQDATNELGKVVIKGKVTGDAAFEATLEQSRGSILIGGRITDPAGSANPLKFTLSAAFSAPYPYVKEDQDEVTGKEFQKKIKGDRISLIWTDKKAQKLALNEEIDATSPAVNGPGIAGVEIDIISYAGKKLNFAASTNSAITMKNARPQPLRKGFSLHWTADPAKDPDGKARLAITVK
jgi:hypothetical protein